MKVLSLFPCNQYRQRIIFTAVWCSVKSGYKLNKEIKLWHVFRLYYLHLTQARN